MPVKRALIIAGLALAGCGVAFTEESAEEEPEVIFLEYGIWQPPPAEDVCIPKPHPTRTTRTAPDAGRSR